MIYQNNKIKICCHVLYSQINKDKSGEDFSATHKTIEQKLILGRSFLVTNFGNLKAIRQHPKISTRVKLEELSPELQSQKKYF